MTERYAEVDPRLPLVLLPLRLETRSQRREDGGWDLRVRVYPDDLSVSSVARGLTPVEVDAARAYWTATWSPRAADDPDPWAGLMATVGRDRAPWVAEAMRPVNPADRGTTDPVFPDPPVDLPDGADASPRAVLLPDALRVVVEQSGSVVSTVGAPIPADGVPTGGSGDALGRSLQVLTGAVVDPDDPLAWLTDFAAAERIGLGIRVPLPHGDAVVERVSVVGVRTAGDADTAAADLTWLLTAHQHGDGSALLAPGTVTNNTPDSRAGWSRVTSRPAEPPVDLTAPPHRSAGHLLAHALGLPSTTFAGWDGAEHRGDAWAAAMMDAVWPVTWGGFLDRSLARPMRRVTAAAVREHAQYVRGRGPLPVLRIGRQPYGVLPATVLDEVQTGGAQRPITELLRRLAPWWRAAGERVPHVGQGDLSDVLPEILGHGPVSRTVRVRRAVGLDGPMGRVAERVDPGELAARRMLVRASEMILGVRPGTFAEPSALGVQRLLGLPFSDERDLEVLTAILELARGGAPVAEWSSLLQVLVALSEAQGRAEVDRLMGRERGFIMRDRLDAARGEVGDELVDLGMAVFELLLAGELDDLGLFAKAAQAFDEPDAPWSADRFVRRFPVAALRPHPIDVAGPDVVEVLQAVAVTMRAALALAQTRTAITVLLKVDAAAERARLLGETLDCASHRYDAWVTSLATHRLHQLRQARPTGVAVGAFGVVEQLRPVDPAPVQEPPAGVEPGLLHPPRTGGAHTAPSIPHAATAAVLRGARLTHNPTDDVAGALEIDLTSTRVRAAMTVLDGVRAGQPLGALVGYRFERSLHDATPNHELNAYVPSLRTLAPLVAAKGTDRVAVGPAPAPLESVAAHDVVDGVRLRELYLAERNADGTLPAGSSILARLQAPPPGFTHYAAQAWQPPDAAAIRHLEDALRGIDALLDAVADLLLSEGVHQLVSGSPARAAAAMDAIAGDAVPAQPDVVQPPPSGPAYTHRLLVLAGSRPPAGPPAWTAHPRSAVDPALAAWVRSALGPVTSIALAHEPGRPTMRLPSRVLTPLELVVATDAGPQVLWARLRRAVPGLPQQPLDDRPADLDPALLTFGEAWALAASIRALLAGGRALLPADLAMPGAAATQLRAVDVADLRRRAGSAVDALAAVPATAADRTAQLRLADRLARFGISGGVDPDSLEPDELAAHLVTLLDQRNRRVAAAAAALTAFDTEPPDAPEASARALADAIGTVFGDQVPVLPQLAAAGADDAFVAAWRRRGVAPPDGAAIRPWLATMGRVRPAVARHGEVVLLREAVRGPQRLRVVQLPAAGPDRWVALPFPDGVAPTDAVTAIVVDAPAGLRPAGPLVGLVVDGWTETVPRRRPVEAAAPSADLVTAGVAVHANGPDARAPQTILLGISPDGEPWTWERLVSLVTETVALARARLVTLERAPLGGAILPAIWAQDWSLQGEPVLDPRVLVEYADARAVMPYVREMGG
jgi:hypothetical protein